MLLHHEALVEALAAPSLDDRLIVTPLLDPERQVGEGSIDLRLGTEFLIFRRALQGGVDPRSEQLESQLEETQEALTVPLGKSLWLHPQQFILGATLEFIRLPATVGGYVLGRSSWGRAGLLVATAVVVQPGFAGALTLELVNEGDSPIRLYPGLRVAQLTLHSLPSPTQYAYAGRDTKYVSPTGPQPSFLGREREEIERIVSLGLALARTPAAELAGVDER